MSSNFCFLLIVLSSAIVIFITTWRWTPQQGLNFNSLNERSEFFRNKFWLLKGSLDILKNNFETVNEPNGDELIYCDEDFVEDFGEEEEKVFSNRNQFDHLTRQLEDEVLTIMTSTSPCSSTSSPKPSSTRPSPRRGEGEDQQAELQNVKSLLGPNTVTNFYSHWFLGLTILGDILQLCVRKNYFAKQHLLVTSDKDHQLLHLIQDPSFTTGKCNET